MKAINSPERVFVYHLNPTENNLGNLIPGQGTHWTLSWAMEPIESINPGEGGGGGPTDPPLLYFYAPRANETKLILFA